MLTVSVLCGQLRVYASMMGRKPNINFTILHMVKEKRSGKKKIRFEYLVLVAVLKNLSAYKVMSSGQ